MTDPEIKAVDAALTEAADQTPQVPDALMAAVLRDAAQLQPAPTREAAPVRVSLWDSFLDLIGGWPAMGGLAAAGMAGVWLGFAPPVALEGAAAQLLGTVQTVDLLGADVLSSFDVDEVVQ